MGPDLDSRSEEARKTYDPEQPPLHVVDGNHVAGVLDHVGHEESRQPERRVEVRAQQTEASEEALHGQVGNVRLESPISDVRAYKPGQRPYNKLEGEESTGVVSQVSHEVDDDVVYKDTGDRERNVRHCVSNDDGGWSVKPVTKLYRL